MNPAIFFLFAVLLLHKPFMLIGFYDPAFTVFSTALYAVAALLLTGPIWERLRSLAWTERGIFGILLLSGLVHGIFCRTLDGWGTNLIYFALPLFGCVWKNELKKAFPHVMIATWTISVTLSLAQWILDVSTYGIPGNWNWNALLIAVSAPFVLFRFRWIPVRAAVLVVSVALLWKCGSRAAVLGLLLTGLLFLLFSLRGKRRVYAWIFLLIGIAAGGFVFRDRIVSRTAAEIRPILWEQAAELVRRHPLGTGMTHYEKEFSRLRSPEYFKHPHAAARSPHPHNEVLYLAGGLGIPAALAVAVLMVMGLVHGFSGFPEKTIEEKLLFAVLLQILFSSMVDLGLNAWPSAEFGWILAGMFLRRKPLPETRPGWRGLAVPGLCIFLLAGKNAVGSVYAQRALEAKTPEQRLRNARRAAVLFPGNDLLMYRVIAGASSPSEILPLSELLENPDFARIHGMRAYALALAGKDGPAFEEYRREAELYPLSVLPVLGMITCAGRTGRTDLLPVLNRELENRMRIRNLSRNDLREIMRNPSSD